MSDDAVRHHGHTGDRREEDEIPEPTYAERARSLLARAREGTLATLSRRHPGFPFASLMPYALDGEGRPLVLVSELAVHTRNLQEDDRASLLVTEPDAGDRDPLGLARVTLLGRLASLPEAGAEDARARYLERHPNARHWVDYPDFGFRKLEVEDAYYVGGFGVMGWVGAGELADADPDPLIDAAASILRHVNEDHADALVLLARHRGVEDAEEARMTAVDRLGYHLRVRTSDGVRGIRIAFPGEVRSPGEVREAMVQQVGEARATPSR